MRPDNRAVHCVALFTQQVNKGIQENSLIFRFLSQERSGQLRNLGSTQCETKRQMRSTGSNIQDILDF